MVLGVAVNCDNTEQIVGNFTEKLEEQALEDLMQITQDVLAKYSHKEESEPQQQTDHQEFIEIDADQKSQTDEENSNLD